MSQARHRRPIRGSSGRERLSGPLAFMTAHPVAANLLMVIFLVGGFVMSGQVRQEVFPDYTLDEVRIDVSYPGASPEDVEQGVLLPIEDAVQNVVGIRRMTSFASEGAGRVSIEILPGISPQLVVNDVQSAVDGITVIPAHLDRPTVMLRTSRVDVLTVVVHGDVEERVIRELAEQTRDGLLAQPEISRVALSGMRAPEISIEVSEAAQRAYGFTLTDIARSVGAAAIDAPAGGLRTPGGEVLLRTAEGKRWQPEFEDILLRAGPTGSNVRLGDVATVHDGFQDLNRLTYFNGERAARLVVARVGDQTPIEVSRATRRFLEANASVLPPRVSYAIWQDEAEEFGQRIDLLLTNAYTGLVLVLVVMGLFLNVKLAFWVTLGVPIAFSGALFFMPLLGVSFNMISLFAFILSLGIIVDYAIVVGEAIHGHRIAGLSPTRASIAGVQEVAGPLCISLLTTATVFLPLLAIPGSTGKLFQMIPVVVVLLLVMALVAALVILPAHLARSSASPPPAGLRWLVAAQQYVADGLMQVAAHTYLPLLRRLLAYRYLTISLGAACLLVVAGVVESGRLTFSFFPPVEGTVAAVDLRMPFGTDAPLTHAAATHLLVAGRTALAEVAGDADAHQGVLIEHGQAASDAGPLGSGAGARSHVARLSFDLGAPESRPFSTEAFVAAWRAHAGEITGAEAVVFGFSSGLDAGRPISIQLAHADSREAEQAALVLAEHLQDVRGVLDVDSGVGRGKEQLDLRLRVEARSLGVTESALAAQLRAAFQGIEALRFQRGRDEIRVFVRRPLGERQSEDFIERMMLHTPGGGEVPLTEAATVSRSRGAVSISRESGRRIVTVSAALTDGVTSREVMTALQAASLPELLSRFPGLHWSTSGEQQAENEALARLGYAVALAIFGVYTFLAFAFRSYVQPIVLLLVVPFACIGAVLGHLLLGYTLSFMSIMGMTALAGIVVNASLLLLSAANHSTDAGVSQRAAIEDACFRRFRPIVLTATTTFIGLAPMMFETSVQAAFLVPMAISLGFGIVFGTVICLFFVPCLYLIFDDVRRVLASR